MARIRQYLLAIISPLLIAAIVCGAIWFTSARNLAARLIDGPQIISVSRSPASELKAHPGETVTAEFTVTNIYNRSIRLFGANTSCGCTVVTTKFPIELEPNASTTLIVQIHIDKPIGLVVKQEAHLLVNCRGVVPPLLIEARVF